MMRNTITRTMATSEIHACRLIMKDGAPVVETLPVLTISGKATTKDAEKELRKVYGKNAPVTVTNIKVSEDVYEISVEDFLKYAKKIDKAQTETDGNVTN